MTSLPTAVRARLRAALQRVPGLQALRRRALRHLSRRYLLITGCQRSGTTLLLLMMDAHPDIRGTDESESGYTRHPGLRRFCGAFASGRRHTCKKMPAASGDLATLRHCYPDARVVWMVRSPLAVVSSMRRLRVDGERWLEGRPARQEVEQLARLFPEARALPSRCSPVELGAHIWALNCRARDRFERAGLQVHTAKFEALLADPEAATRALCARLSVAWHPALLSFHERRRNANRVLAGGTRGDWKVDPSRGTPELHLTEQEQEQVLAVCAPWAEQHGYT